MLIVSGIAALAMALGAVVLHGDGDDQDDEQKPNLSVAAIMLDTVADAAAAAGVAAAGAIILAMGGWYWLNPSIALVIAAVVTFHAVRLILKAHAHLRSRPSDAVDRPQQ